MLLTIFIVILFCDTHSLHFEDDLQCRDFAAYCTCTCTTFVPRWQPLDHIDRVRGYGVELALSVQFINTTIHQAGGLLFAYALDLLSHQTLSFSNYYSLGFFLECY